MMKTTKPNLLLIALIINFFSAFNFQAQQIMSASKITEEVLTDEDNKLKPAADNNFLRESYERTGVEDENGFLKLLNPPCNISVNPGSATVCAGASVVFTNSGAQGNSYTWSATPITSTATTKFFTVTPAGSTIYTVTGNGCSNSVTVAVTVISAPLVSSGSSAVCIGSTTTLTASGATSYTWSPAISLNTNTGNIVTAGPTVATSYTVMGSQSGCINSATVHIGVNSLPTISSAANPQAFCSGESSTLTAFGPSTFSWSPAGSLNTSTGSLVIASPTITTVYTVTGTDNNGCSNSDVLTVTVNSLPTISSAASPQTFCSGQSSTLTAFGPPSFIWSPAGSLNTNTGSPVVASPTITTTYTITGTDTNGCVNTAEITVTVNPLPTVSALANPQIFCQGESSTLTASGAESYTWTPAGSLNVNTGSLVISSATISTTYNVAGTGINGCVNSVLVSVTVNSLPTVNAVANSEIICAGESSTLTTSGALSFTWSPAGSLNTNTGNTVIASPGSNTTYTVTGMDNNGCVNSAAVSVTVNSLPTVSALPNPSVICNGLSSTLTASGASSYSWTTSGSLSSPTGSSVISTPSVTTIYTVTGTDINGCVNSAVVAVSISSGFVADAGTDQIVYAGYIPMQCTALNGLASGGAAPYQYTWSPGGASQSIAVCPTVTTIYTLTVSDNNGCTDTDEVTVIAVNAQCGKDKVVICHNGHTICVSPNAVPAHLGHGDNVGPCLPGAKGVLNVTEPDENEKMIALFPNPSTGLFTVEILRKDINDQVKIQVTNSLGQIVYSKDSQPEEDNPYHKIQLNKALPSGIYFLHVEIGNEKRVNKILLEK